MEYKNFMITQAYSNTTGLCENKSERGKKKFKLVPGRAWKKVCSYWQAPQCRSRKVVDARYRNVWASPLPHCQHRQFPGTPANIQYCLTTSSTFPNSLVSQDPKRIELFSYSMGLLVRSWSPMIFHWLFCIQYQQLPFTCDACPEVLFEFEWRATYLGCSLRAKLIQNTKRS